METATFGNGCFWCTEAIFQGLRGVGKVASGYSGGSLENPTYEQVCTGTTGHAEVIQVTFDPSKITYVDLLRAFFASHDPTTLNRQGNDVGTQYRSAIFYHDENQRETAEEIRKELDESDEWSNPIVTEIVPFEAYYPAGDYHENYFKLNGSQPYCNFVIRPKVEKFKKNYAHMLK